MCLCWKLFGCVSKTCSCVRLSKASSVCVCLRLVECVDVNGL